MKDPLQIFDELRKNQSCRIKSLWPHQEEVLKFYYDTLAKEKRIAIELPTGAGKSLISLLILEGWRQAGKKVAILTSSKTLAIDMVKKAGEVGIKAFEITGKTGLSEDDLTKRDRYLIAYKRGAGIAVMNYWAYLYGDLVTPDVLAIDDAHSFENVADSHFSLHISREDHEVLYNRILNNLKTAHPIYQRLESIEQYLTPTHIYEVIYLPHMLEVLKDIEKYFFSLKDKDKPEYWQFQRNVDRLHTYFMLINRESILLKPIVSPIEAEEKLRLVDKIIYLSATLGTHEVFQKSVGSYLPIKILSESDLNNRIGTMGKRLIFPLSLTPDTGFIDERVSEAVETILRQFGKAVVFCVSKNEREEISKYLRDRNKMVFHYTYESDVDSFSKQGAGTALITAGRYIGLDLPSKICQVGIITRIPFNFDPLDSFIENQLEDMDFIYQQVAHRLVQAFGRCNRSLTDIAVYFCLDGRFESEITGAERITKHFPCELMAQAQLGYEKSKKSLNKSIENGKLFLGGEMPKYESEVKEIIELIPPRGRGRKECPEVIYKEIKGWNEFITNKNYYTASQLFTQCADEYSSQGSGFQNRRRSAWFWYWAAICDYLQFKYQNAGEALKKDCIEKFESAIKQGNSGWFNNMRVIVNELKGETTESAVIQNSVDWTFREKVLRNWKDFSANNTIKRKTPLSAHAKLLEDMQKGSHEVILKAAEELFYLYGFEVRNFSRQQGESDLHFYANDTQNKYMVLVEVKSKKDSDVLGKTDVDQAKSNITHYQQKYSMMGMEVYCLIITNKSVIDPLAIKSAKRTCKILKSNAAMHLAKLYLPIIEKSWKLPDDHYERVLFLDKIPTLENLRSLFEESDEPEIIPADVEKIFDRTSAKR